MGTQIARRLGARLAVASCISLVSGCGQIEGLFGPTAQEQTQIQILRGIQHALSLSYNQPLNWMFQGVTQALSMRLPTFYGMDLAPYLATVPWPPTPQPADNVQAPLYGDNQPQPQQQANGEVYELMTADQRNILQFLFNPQSTQPQGNQTSSPDQLPCTPPSCKSLTYDVNLLRSMINVTGSLQVTTTTRTTWSKMSTPAPHQPYVFGDNWKTSQPNELDASVNLNYEGQSGTISLSLSRTQAPSNDPNMQLQQVQFNLGLPRITCQLSGRVRAGSLAFSNGTISLTDDQGTSHEFQVTMFDLAGNSGEATMIDQQDLLSVNLTLDNGQLSGEVDSTDPNLPRSLATITTAGTRTFVTYRDRGTPESWN